MLSNAQLVFLIVVSGVVVLAIGVCVAIAASLFVCVVHSLFSVFVRRARRPTAVARFRSHP
jgi:MFS superfamily sulfate permease-like transporter